METYVGDIIELSIETTIDLLDLSLEILYERPNGTIGSWVASKSPTINSEMVYTTSRTDLNIPGIWKLQAYAYSDISVGHGKIVDLTVYDTLYTEHNLDIFIHEHVYNDDNVTV